MRCECGYIICDHNMITFTVQYECEVPVNIRTIRDYHRGDYEGIKSELGHIDWNHELSGNMDVCWNRFKHLFLDLVDKYIPLQKTHKSRRMKKPIWMSHKALRSVTKKNRKFKKYKDKNHPAVKKANKKVTKELRKAKYNFEKKLADSIKHDKNRSMHTLEANLK